MATADVSYVPGALTAVAGDHCWALVEVSPDFPAVGRIWQQLGQGVAADALLASLVANGMGGTPGFTLLVAEAGGQHRLFCRGTVGATVVTKLPGDGAPQGQGRAAADRVDGAGLLTWREQVVGDAERIILGAPPADTVTRLPATSGVLLAGCMLIDFAGSAAREKTAVFFPDTITMTHPGSVAAPAAVTGAVGQGGSDDREPPALAVPTVPFTPSLNGADGNGEYDFLWGATQARSVEDAAIRDGGEDGPAQPVHFPLDSSWPGPPPGGPPPVAASPPSTESGPPPGSLIDAPQWLSGPGDSSSTVKRGEIAEIAARTSPPDRIGPVVPALICLAGHVNPPSGVTCRRCGGPLPHDPVPVPRPVLGVLRLSQGDVITLDRGVLMGRSPRTDFDGPDGPGVPGGAERPHVVKLPSAGGDISRTHLRVTLDGWHVLVTDLHSTNGTLVTLPGREPVQLRPGEPMPIQAGTVVTLAEDVDFRYEEAE